MPPVIDDHSELEVSVVWSWAGTSIGTGRLSDDGRDDLSGSNYFEG